MLGAGPPRFDGVVVVVVADLEVAWMVGFVAVVVVAFDELLVVVFVAGFEVEREGAGPPRFDAVVVAGLEVAWMVGAGPPRSGVVAVVAGFEVEGRELELEFVGLAVLNTRRVV
jgi:hypothetical protein